MPNVALARYATALRRTRYMVRPIAAAIARPLIESFHYAGGVGNTGTIIMGLFCRADPLQRCLGVTWFHPPALGAAKEVGGAEHRRVLALSRTTLVPWAPRNSATFLLGASIRYIRSLRDQDGVTPRWWRLVTYADEWQARHAVHKRIPGGIYRGPTGCARAAALSALCGSIATRAHTSHATQTASRSLMARCGPAAAFPLDALRCGALPMTSRSRRASKRDDRTPCATQYQRWCSNSHSTRHKALAHACWPLASDVG